MSGTNSMDAEMQVGFDAMGNPGVNMIIDGRAVSGMTADAAEHLAMMLLSAVTTSRVRATTYRGLLREGWSVEDAMGFVEMHKG